MVDDTKTLEEDIEDAIRTFERHPDTPERKAMTRRYTELLSTPILTREQYTEKMALMEELWPGSTAKGQFSALNPVAWNEW